jgi:hypothetical protein
MSTILLPAATLFLLPTSVAAQSASEAEKIYNSAPESTGQAPPPLVSLRVAGPEEVVFDHATQGCDILDIPDDAARAFRDRKGVVHLMASHYLNRAMLGPDLDHVQRDCHVVYQASANPDPSQFDDFGWLETFYTADGIHVHALISMDYHPFRHNLPCGSTPAEDRDCWYSALVQADSKDGGRNFTTPKEASQRLVATAPYQFDPNHSPTTGALVPTNIIQWKGYYYTLISSANDRAQPGGDCIMRTQHLDAPGSWRAWDGKGYNLAFIDPYPTAPADPAMHVCTTVGADGRLFSPVRTLLKFDSGGFIAVMVGPTDKNDMTIYASTSLDLINWSRPIAFAKLPIYGRGSSCAATPGKQVYYYPSLLDPHSSARNFETVGNTAYLYATRYAYCANMKRDLVRYPIVLTPAK